MSVINKMLKDIEHRESNDALYLDPTVKVENVRNNTQLFQRIGLVAMAVSIAIGAYWFIPSKQQDEPVIAAQVQKFEPQKISQAVDKQKKSVESDDADLKKVKTSALKVAQERIKTLEADIAKKETEQTLKPLASSEQVKESIKEPEQQTIALAKEVIPPPTIIKDKPKSVAKIRKISTRERAENWFTQGKEAFQFGLIEDAIAALDKTLILMPLHIEARSLLAAAYYGREQSQEAESILRHGLSLNPDVMRWRILLAKILVEKGSYQSVAPVLSKRYEVNANIDFWILKGTASQQLGEHKVAQNCFGKLTQLEPGEAKWWLALATSNDALGNYHNAKRFYLTAIELGGLSPNAHNHAKQRLAKIGLL